MENNHSNLMHLLQNMIRYQKYLRNNERFNEILKLSENINDDD